MKSNIFNLDWDSFNYRDPAQRKKLAGALQYFLALPNKFVHQRFSKVAEFVKQHRELQAFTTMSDGYPNEKAIEVVEKFHMAAEYDNGYEQIFNIADFSGTKASGFDVSAVHSGITFSEILPGEKAKVFQFQGAKYRCYFCYYGAALGWHRQVFEDGDWWALEDNAIAFRSAAYSSRAAVYYALLEAAADASGCCTIADIECSDCSERARNVANAINACATSILEKVRNRGYNLNPATTQFVVLTPLRLRGIVKEALGVKTQAFDGSTPIVDFSFQQITSMMLSRTNRVMVILPGRTLKAGYRMDLTLFDNFDILSYTDTVAGWMRHGGCIGDIDQVACFETEPISASCPPGGEFAPLGGCEDVEVVAARDGVIGNRGAGFEPAEEREEQK